MDIRHNVSKIDSSYRGPFPRVNWPCGRVTDRFNRSCIVEMETRVMNDKDCIVRRTKTGTSTPWMGIGPNVRHGRPGDRDK